MDYIMYDATGLIVITGTTSSEAQVAAMKSGHEENFDRTLTALIGVRAAPNQYVHLDEEGSPVITDEPPE